MVKRHRTGHVLVPILGLIALWSCASHGFGGQLVPGPVVTGWRLAELACDLSTWRHVCLTIYRGTAGLVVGAFWAYLLGLPCGLSPVAMRLVSPVVTALHSCPPIVWISLLLVWSGVGATVPIIVVAAAVFPVLFVNIAGGVASLDRGLFEMARVYRLSRYRIVVDVIVPGISRYALAAFSFALGITWKVAATAEFFGAANGIGARIYWAYRVLDMPLLFAWTVLIVTIGVILETGVIQPLRGQFQAQDGAGRGAP